MHTVAEQIGYRRNRAGVRLRTGKTQVISLVISLEEEMLDMTSQIVQGITNQLTDTAYHLVVTPYTAKQQPIEAVQYVVETGSADGIILSRIERDDARLHYLSEKNFPFVCHGRSLTGLEHAYHDFDNYRFCHDAIELLASRGRKTIAALMPPERFTYHQHAMEGFAAATRKHGLEPFLLPGLSTDSRISEIEQQVETIMRGDRRPDGLICLSASSAVAATCGIENAQLSLGTDIDMVAKNSIDFLPRFRPAIFAIHENMRRAGENLADAILAAIDGKPPGSLQSIDYTEGLLQRIASPDPA